MKGKIMTFTETVAALVVLRCSSYMESNGATDPLSSFPSLKAFVGSLSDADLEHWAKVTGSSFSPDEKNGSTPEERYLRALSFMGGGEVSQNLLDMGIALFLFPEFSAFLTAFFGYSLNIHLAFLLEDILTPSEEEIQKILAGASRLFYIDKKLSPIQYAELSFDEKTMGFLEGNDGISPFISDFSYLFDPAENTEDHEAFIHAEVAEKGADFFKKGGSILQIGGAGGRRFLSKKIASDIGRKFLFVSLPDLFREAGKEGLSELREALVREAVFDDAGILFHGITDTFLKGGNGNYDERLTRDLALLERLLFTPIKDADIPLILCTDAVRPILLTPGQNEYLFLELPKDTDYEERKVLWKKFSELYGLTLDADTFAMRYRLGASEISQIIRSFLEHRPETKVIGEAEEKLFTRLCMQRAETMVQDTVGRVSYPAVRLDDVKVKENVRALLDDVITGIRSSGTILDEWELRNNYPYGRSVSVLLSGPPGTGKTMTANALAGELGLPLYQVNLSNIVDKYIGETEKNLEKAFLFAEKTDSVLFFDEADALFGTRSEVHDSKDRYANNEISYLLQRIESYDGIVIMATNLKSNMDPAFLRRIRYVIHYENPDKELRRQIWESCLAEKVPHEKIDLDYLAEQFDTFSGSVIKTVFLNACAYAAGKGEKLGMVHLVHAISNELQKTSTVAFTGEALGKYAYLK